MRKFGAWRRPIGRMKSEGLIECGRCAGRAAGCVPKQECGDEERVMTSLQVRGVCPHDCPDTCGVITEVKDGRAVKFSGDRGHPITKGWLCAKVRPYLNHVYHPDRLMHPLRRVGPKGGGRWERMSWDAALREIAGRWQEI